MTSEFFPENSPGEAAIAQGVSLIKLQSLITIEGFVASGAFPRDLGVWMEEPIVERLPGGGVVIHEQMRIL